MAIIEKLTKAERDKETESEIKQWLNPSELEMEQFRENPEFILKTLGEHEKRMKKEPLYSCLEKLLQIHRQMKKELGREPTTEEISKETEIEPRVIVSLMGMACMDEKYDCLCREQDMPMAEPEEVEE